jgi:hypothetical protein
LEYIGCLNKPKEELEYHLLLLDGHESNWNLEMVEFARQYNVIILQFPLHTSHILQPLDCNVFRRVKECIRKAKARPQFRDIKDKWDLLNFLVSPLQEACTVDTIRDGFRIAGVWPPRFREECVVANKLVPITDVIQDFEKKDVSPSKNEPSSLSTAQIEEIQLENLTSIEQSSPSSQLPHEPLLYNSTFASNSSTGDLILNRLDDISKRLEKIEEKGKKKPDRKENLDVDS